VNSSGAVGGAGAKDNGSSREQVIVCGRRAIVRRGRWLCVTSFKQRGHDQQSKCRVGQQHAWSITTQRNAHVRAHLGSTLQMPSDSIAENKRFTLRSRGSRRRGSAALDGMTADTNGRWKQSVTRLQWMKPNVTISLFVNEIPVHGLWMATWQRFPPGDIDRCLQRWYNAVACGCRVAYRAFSRFNSLMKTCVGK
jgi:hypothetical protein